MLQTTGDIITEVLVRNNRSTTDTFITDAMLQDWTRQAHTWAAAQKPWPMTEGRIATTWAGSEELSFEGYKADSFRFIQVGGKRLQKLNFENYQTLREENSSATDRVYTDYGRTVFVNPNIDASGTLVAYGQYQPVIDATDTSAKTVFTDWDDEGNEAIVEKVSSFLKRREHLAEEAELHDERATAKLNEVWDRIGKEQFAYHAPAGDGIFKRFDVVEGGFRDDLFNRDQFN